MRFSKESPIPNSPRIEAAMPDAALPGGEIEIRGTQLGSVRSRLPVAVLDGIVAPVLLSRSNRMIVRIPEDVQTGRLEIRQNGQSSNTIRLKIARLITGNLHPVGNPAVDAEGNIFSTDSGPRGQKTAVSVYRITPTGRDAALGERDYQCHRAGNRCPGISRTCPRGWMARCTASLRRALLRCMPRVWESPPGLRSIPPAISTWAIAAEPSSRLRQDRQIFVFATLEPSIAAYHLAFGLDGTLFVTAPSTSSYDSIYAIDQAGVVRVYYRGLGPPAGTGLRCRRQRVCLCFLPRHPRHRLHYSGGRSLGGSRWFWYCWSRFRARRQRDPGRQWRGL